MLIHGVAADSSNGPRGEISGIPHARQKAYPNEESGLVRRASNGTTTSRSASASSVSPCTTTVTSVLGQHLDATKGECQTVTIVSTPEVKSTSMTSTETSLKPTTSAILTSS